MNTAPSSLAQRGVCEPRKTTERKRPMDDAAGSEVLAAAGGGAAPELARRLLLQAAGADLEDDPLSAMLAVQAAAVHEAALGLLRRAADCAGESDTGAVCARQAARLLHLFVRQVKTLEGRRETARLEAQAAEFARREEAELQRRRELEERRWDAAFGEDEFDEEEFGEDAIGDDAMVEDEADGGDAGARAAAAGDRAPAAGDAAGGVGGRSRRANRPGRN